MSVNESENKIPKRIHYCWFGGKEKPDVVIKLINNWKRLLHDYELIEWNEKNFNINSNSYVKEAYQNKKYAFVSDYVRAHALYNEGGIYLDTDVEVFRTFDNLLYHESFWGFEQGNFIATSTIGATKGNKVLKLLLDSYRDRSFLKNDGSFDELTNVAIITKILKEIGVEMNGKYQEFIGFGAIYPQTYFSPYDYINCRCFLTETTYTLHHFNKSWLPTKARLKSNMKVLTSKVIGGDNIARIRQLVSTSRRST
ncbi:glycosyltransferase family 32 protein [Virgibacillus phasianinus]|uniref:glycosyltransferase family 32 protein n=1 Tax=Virgibacillus phasianinus TaxID=2017483 RepID=UPI001FE337E7|nr:glycosyltransferase [Virgibacillus phasianinus]